MKVINLFGAAGSGKSTNAAGLTYELKAEGLRVELINEYAKELCLIGAPHLLGNQINVFSEQYSKMKWLSHELDFIVTDSPLLLSKFYGETNDYEFERLYPLVDEVFNSFDNINILLERNHPWDGYGRVQTEEDSLNDNKRLEAFLDENGVQYHKFKTGRYLPSVLKKFIIENNIDVIENKYKG